MADFFQTSLDYLVGHTEVRHIMEDGTIFDLNAKEAQFIDNCCKLSKPERDSLLLVAENYIALKKK